MSRFRLLIEYEGSSYHGWQLNAGVKTIQGEMLQACVNNYSIRRKLNCMEPAAPMPECMPWDRWPISMSRRKCIRKPSGRG